MSNALYTCIFYLNVPKFQKEHNGMNIIIKMMAEFILAQARGTIIKAVLTLNCSD